MLRRKAYEKLALWKHTKTKQALLVSGARQVGKTYLIRAFARDVYESVVEINLLEDKQALASLTNASSAQQAFERLTLIAGAQLIPHKTLIFIDEVQECKELVTFVKFFCDKHGEYDYIFSGSLLGIELKDIRSTPVGYLREVKMFPLDVVGFCWARGVGESSIANVRECFANRRPVDEFANEYLTGLFHEYLVVGGMPDAVQSYCDNRNLQAVREIQNDIVTLYKADIAKYLDVRDALRVKAIYELMPSELDAHNKRFVVSDLGKGTRLQERLNDFLWLVAAGIALDSYNVNAPVYPLLASKKSSLFKLFFSDVGLLISRYAKQSSLNTLDRKPGVNYGSIYENAVAQELVAHGHDLYYYTGSKRGELDFLMESESDHVVPIEVKSGKDYKRHSALTGTLGIGDWHIKQALVLCEANISQSDDGRILYAPIYCTMCLDSE